MDRYLVSTATGHRQHLGFFRWRRRSRRRALIPEYCSASHHDRHPTLVADRHRLASYQGI